MESQCHLVVSIQVRVCQLMRASSDNDMCQRILEICRLLKGLLINLKGGNCDMSKILSRREELSAEKVGVKVEEVSAKNGLPSPLGHVQQADTDDHPLSDIKENSIPSTILEQRNSDINKKFTEDSPSSNFSNDENLHEKSNEEQHHPFISDQESIPSESCRDESKENREHVIDNLTKSSRSKRTLKILDNSDHTNCSMDESSKPKKGRRICPTCGQKIAKRHFEEHYGNCRAELSRIKPCKKCGASFQTQKQLISHRRLCLLEAKCKKCQVRMKSNLLKDHERNCQNTIHRLCEDCGVDRFSDLKSFNQHR